MNNNISNLISTLSEHVDLGHSKRDDAFLRQVQSMCMNPGKTACGGAADPAAVMSAYRFASNPKASLEDLRSARMSATLSNIEDGETVLLINDISLLDYCSHESKEDRRCIGDGKGKGYEYNCNLAVSLEREQVLGVLHDCVISAEGPDDTDEVDYFDTPLVEKLPEKSIAKLPCNHKHAITVHALHVTRKAPEVKFISTADREFDDYFHFYALKQAGMDAVIRSCAQRNVQFIRPDWFPEEELSARQAGLPLRPGYSFVNMKRLTEHIPLTHLKSVYLDGKGRLTDKGAHAEEIPVSAGACRVTLYRQAKRDKVYVKPFDYVELNVVVVKESSPRENSKHINWVLFTTLPVDTTEQINRVVRIYELRWQIECFFKLLKSGFGLEDLRYNNAQKTARHLVVTTIAATFISALKSSVGLGPGTKLDDETYSKLKHASKNLNDSSIDIRLRLFVFIARQGKWLGYRRNGISPLMLMKGLTKTLYMLMMMNSMSNFFLEAAQFLKE